MQQYQYGIPVDKLRDLIKKLVPSARDGAEEFLAASHSSYQLTGVRIAQGSSYAFQLENNREATLFIEIGDIVIDGIAVSAKEVFSCAPNQKHTIEAKTESAVYIFSGKAEGNDYQKKGTTTNVREKYWGSIEDMVNKDYTGKRMFYKKEQNSSLHYHINKDESYYVHSGLLLLRLRAGRGEDRFFELPAGSAIDIPRGLMHQDGGLEDTVIIEVSTHDEDADSFIVEDGQKQNMFSLYHGGK